MMMQDMMGGMMRGFDWSDCFSSSSSFSPPPHS